ncbi:hypothetical protein [Kribbella sp. NPDC003557]|uniref:YqeB family protein n=1 Tax=Kribbella sp. NPDC003557 TaxID=3154449 RepID=UPI0033A4B1D8
MPQLVHARKPAPRAGRRHPDWIEVRPDGITAVRASGSSWELVRNDDSVLRIVESRGRPYLQLDGITSTGRIPLARFDADELHQATQAEGWPWSPTLATPETNSPSSLNTNRWLGVAGVVAAGVLVLAFEGGSPVAIMFAVMGPGVLLALGLVWLSVRHALRVKLTVAVRPDRVTVTRGTLASQVVQRTAVTSSTVGRRYVRLRGPDGKTLLYVPLNPQRTAVLNALSANGWPV